MVAAVSILEGFRWTEVLVATALTFGELFIGMLTFDLWLNCRRGKEKLAFQEPRIVNCGLFNRLCRQTGRIDRARDGNVTGLSDEEAKSAAMPRADRSAMNSSLLQPRIVAVTAKSVPGRPGFIRA